MEEKLQYIGSQYMDGLITRPEFIRGILLAVTDDFVNEQDLIWLAIALQMEDTK